MAVIFVSHSSRDDGLVRNLENWLRANGFDEYFVDHTSIAAGDKWAAALRQATATCRVVICLVTEGWLASSECYAEFNAAWYLGKRIIPLYLLRDEAALSPEQKARLAKVRAEDQGIDLRRCLQADGQLDLERDGDAEAHLRGGLRAAGALSRIGLDPQAFAVNPRLRPEPFPGLLSFGDDDADAALFYGRSGEVAGVLEELRKLRASGGQRPFGILGASGAGKSSLLKAGIIPRLRREAPAWIALRTFRPGGDPLLNFAEALSRSLADFGVREAHGVIRDRLSAAWSKAPRDRQDLLSDDGVAMLRAALNVEGEALRRAANRSQATLLISIDQAEELARGEGDSGDALSDYLRAALAGEPPAWLVAFTCRTDSFSELQTHRRYRNLDALCYDLRSLPVFRFDAVVEEPAKRYGVTVEPALIDELMQDAPKDDALPLLAFALQRLWRQYAASGSLSVDQYRKMGGLAGLIEDAAERALRGIEPEQDTPLARSTLDTSLNALGATTFVPALADVNEKGAIIRKPAAWSSFTPDQRALLSHFDRWRLVTRRGEEGGTVEVAHEALFQEWPRLRNEWLEPERASLEALRGLKIAAAAWASNKTGSDYLAHRGERLKQAMALRLRPDYERELTDRDRAYLSACDQEERTHLRRDFGFRWGLRAAVIASLILTSIALWQWRKAEAERDRAERLAEMRLAETRRAEAFSAKAEEQRKRAEDVVLRATLNALAAHRLNRNPPGAIEMLTPEANEGSAFAMFSLGYIYESGQGAPQDYAKAREWYEKAAEKGYAAAMTFLGRLYENGQGLPQDYARAREWYEKAAEKGDADAMNNLGRLYETGQGVLQDYAKARAWYEKAAEKGDAEAMNNLGRLYETGQGVLQDYAKARAWYEKAAEKGDADAMNNLGRLYETGQGVLQGYAKAREWYEKAAERGDATAMANLGRLYEHGRGVPQDYAKARESYEKGIEKGSQGSMLNLGVLYYYGRGVPQDYAKAREWYEKAAEKGHSTAMKNLGVLYYNGEGVLQDYIKAQEWFKKAVETAEREEIRWTGRPGPATAANLGDYAASILFTRRFDEALVAAERALSIAPGEIWIAANRAHALMFSDRAEEARAVYLAHAGNRMPEQQNKLWEQVILDDFAAFEKRGLTHPQMAEIRGLFSSTAAVPPTEPAVPLPAEPR